MKLKVLGSSSAGNCYILEGETEALIIEAGIRLTEVKKALGYDLKKAVGCLVTHQHNDHSKYIRQFMGAGITVLALQDVFEAHTVPLNNSFRQIIQAGRGYKISQFKVYAFSVTHDCPCLGFIIDHPETGKVLFLTDTMSCDYSFPGLTQILIEANYEDKTLDSNIKQGKIPLILRPRIIGSHMEFETTKQILKNQDLTGVRNIVLIHLSDGNSDEQRFIREIKAMTGKQVYAASKGMSIAFNKEPF